MISEAAIQQQTRLLHCKLTGGQNWRNNTGAGRIIDQSGTERMIRWGLSNESEKENREIKSSDIVGITPTLIEPHMVGYYLGVFTAFEIKASGWSFPKPTNRAEYARCLAQQKFHDIVRASCGYAGFVTDPNDILRIINRG